MPMYRVQDEGCGEDFDAADDDAALKHARQWLRGGDWDRSKTMWLGATVFLLGEDGDERIDSVTVILQPEEPMCSADAHAWCSPYSLLGGLKENPGVFGHGGGVRIKEVCRHCGVQRVTDTWATNPCNGTQGHTTVEYVPAGPDELKWVAEQTEEED